MDFIKKHLLLGLLTSIAAECLPGRRLMAQETAGPKAESKFFISQIIVLGNKKTKKEVILREMHTRPNQYATAEALELDRRRIESLGLFNRVQMRLGPGPKGYILEIIVTEQWYLFPFPILFFNDREVSFKKLSYGVGLLHTNFRGMAELMQFSGWLGYNPSVSLTYTNPWFMGRARLFTQLQLVASNHTNKSYDIIDQKVTEQQFAFGWTLGKRLTLHTSLSLTLFYHQLRMKPAVPGQTLSPTGKDRSLQAVITYVRDHRDLIWYPTRGSFIRLDVTQTGLPGAKYIDYGRFAVDVRRYVPLGKMTALAFRLNLNMSRGRVPIYDRVFFGYFHRIRGYFNRRLEGEHRMIASAELRFPIVPVHYFNLDSGSLRSYARDLRFGISGSIFFYAGTLWYKKRNDRQGLPPTSGPFGMQTSPDRWLPG
ncbi:MAG: hypothetical protein D6814_14985, partial [Calditrichaeota bacterium]